MLAALAGCGVTDLFIGSLPLLDGGTTTTSTTTTTTGSTICTPGAARPCYDGPAGTEGVGLCRAGTQACAADGAGWGACAGEVLPQAEDCATPEDEDCDGVAQPCAGTVLWAKQFGQGWLQAVAVDPTDNVIATGWCTGAVDFGGGSLNCPSAGQTMAVAKLDAAGKHVWSKTFAYSGGNAVYTAALGIAVDSTGSVLLTGYIPPGNGSIDFGGGALTNTSGSNYNGFVAKLDASGKHVWSRKFDGLGRAVSVDAAGGVLLLGEFNPSMDLGGGPLPSTPGMFIAKLDASGKHAWSRGCGNGYPTGQLLAVDGAGNVVVAGGFSGQVNFGGGTLTSTGASTDLFVAKLDASGKHVWSKSYGSPGSQVFATGVGVDVAGAVLVTGWLGGAVALGGGTLTTATPTDLSNFAAKLDATGLHVWSRLLGTGFHGKWLPRIAAHGISDVWMTGDMPGTYDFGGGPLTPAGAPDVFVARLTGSSGGYLWAKNFGDAGDQAGLGIAPDSAGNAFVVGGFGGSVDFGTGTGPLVSTSATNMFVAKLSR